MYKTAKVSHSCKSAQKILPSRQILKEGRITDSLGEIGCFEKNLVMESINKNEI